MSQHNESCLSDLLESAGLVAMPTTDPEELVRLLRRLHPRDSGKSLIRLGPEGDGGYLVPDDLEGILACFSPGVSMISGFEKDCAERGMTVFLADKSVDQPQEEHERFNFTRKFVGALSNQDFMTMDDWVTAALPEQDADLLLQMDIEGYEYETLLSTSNNLMRRFKLLVVEFHHLDLLWGLPLFNLAGRVFDKILQTHYCVHIHPNNCCGSVIKHGIEIPRVMEFTFLRRDRMDRSDYRTDFPNALDYDNTDGAPLELPNCWYGGERAAS